MEKYTPGPWEIRSVDGLFAFAGSGGFILENESEEQNKADAQLISAAPDMLAALKAMLTSPIASREAIELAERAIKKAEGKDV